MSIVTFGLGSPNNLVTMGFTGAKVVNAGKSFDYFQLPVPQDYPGAYKATFRYPTYGLWFDGYKFAEIKTMKYRALNYLEPGDIFFGGLDMICDGEIYWYCRQMMKLIYNRLVIECARRLSQGLDCRDIVQWINTAYYIFAKKGTRPDRKVLILVDVICTKWENGTCKEMLVIFDYYDVALRE